MSLKEIRKAEQRASQRNIFFTVQRPMNPIAASRIFTQERQIDAPPIVRDEQQYQEMRQNGPREVGLFSNFFQIEPPPSLSPFQAEPPSINQMGFDR